MTDHDWRVVFIFSTHFDMYFERGSGAIHPARRRHAGDARARVTRTPARRPPRDARTETTVARAHRLMSHHALSFTANVAHASPIARSAARARTPRATRAHKRAHVTRAGNEYENGLFAPIVRVARDVIGVKRFNQIRGKAIALHSQVIGDFCEEFGCDTKVKQNLIRTAKKNGGKLGFLA